MIMDSPCHGVQLLDLLHLRNTINIEHLNSCCGSCLDVRGQLVGAAEDNVSVLVLQLSHGQHILLVPHVKLQSKLSEVLLNLNQRIGSNICGREMSITVVVYVK